MKVQLNRKELLALLEKLKPAVPARSTLPICTSVLLEVMPGKLDITANNLEFALMGSCRAKVRELGAVCVEFAKLLAFLKGTKGETVSIEGISYKDTKHTPVVITSNGASLTMEGNDAADFPPVPEVQGEKAIAYNLAEVLGKVDYCMATEDTRPVLQAVCFRPKDKEGVVELAAADGFRLAVAPVKVKGKLAEMIVPYKVTMAVKKLMPGVVAITQKIEPSLMEPGKSYPTIASFEQKGLKLVCRLTQGIYPDYMKLIPKTTHAVTVERDELLDALKIVWPTKDKCGSNIIRMHTTEGKLVMSHTRDDDKYEATVPCRGGIKIALNGEYLSDLLCHVDDKVTIRTTTPSEPLKVISRGATVVIMPMFVQWDEPKKSCNEKTEQIDKQ